MEPRTRQYLGDLDLVHVHRRAKAFPSLDDRADEIRELVHRLGGLDEGVGPCLVDTFRPRGDSFARRQERLRGLRQRLGTRRFAFEDGHPY